jgi:branched-chain amino acid transport system permease protein
VTDSGSLVLGVLFVVVVLAFRRGILGELMHHYVTHSGAARESTAEDPGIAPTAPGT